MARAAIQMGATNAATSRMYYAAYQAMLGVLHQLDGGFRAPAAEPHRVVLARFDAVSTQTGLCDRALVASVAQMKNERNRADYKPTHVDEQTARGLLDKADTLVARIRGHLEGLS